MVDSTEASSSPTVKSSLAWADAVNKVRPAANPAAAAKSERTERCLPKPMPISHTQRCGAATETGRSRVQPQFAESPMRLDPCRRGQFPKAPKEAHHPFERSLPRVRREDTRKGMSMQPGGRPPRDTFRRDGQSGSEGFGVIWKRDLGRGLAVGFPGGGCGTRGSAEPLDANEISRGFGDSF